MLLLGEWGMDVPLARRVAVSMPVRNCHADGRWLEHGVPGERSYPLRLRAASGSGIGVIRIDECCAVPQSIHMVVCGCADPRVSWRPLLPQQRPPQEGAVSHIQDLPAGSAGLTARFTRLRFIDCESTARKLRALESSNGVFRRGAVGHLDEAKAFGAAGVAINNDTDLVHNTIRLKKLAKVMVCGGERQIANINIHKRFLVGNGANDRQVIRTVCRSKQCKSNM